ncbi:MAG: DUF1214 domain-containing protein [Hyphomicrobiaceae bacterium]
MFWLSLHKLKRSFLTASARVIEAAIVATIILAGGLGSSWYMVEAGSRLTTAKLGPWISWTAAARPDADPYTRAHFVKAGTLPVSAQIQRTLVARTDQNGDRLHSSCEYIVEGALPKVEWWSLAIFDERGRLIPNEADRYTFTGQTVALAHAGNFAVTLAREARPGNWLPTGGAGRLALVLNIAENRTPDSTAKINAAQMPTIRKIKCR